MDRSDTLQLPARYELVRLLASGGMADVYLAEDRALQRPVAIKALAERLESDSSARQRFVREAVTAARMGRHEHVVTVHDVGDSRGRPFLVMEFQPGGSVEDWLRRRGRPRIDQALRWIAQTAAALDAAHEEGVVHRDVKPGNLLLDERGDARVADFGLARPECTQTALTSSGEVLGTAGYISPEQAAGGRATPASDRYALAVVARELLGPRLTASGEAVLERAVSREPERRYPSAGAFVAALEAAVGPEAPATRAPRARRTRRTRLLRSNVTARLYRPLRSLSLSRATMSLTRPVKLGLGALMLVVTGAAAGLAVGGLSAAPAPRREAFATCSLSPLQHDANLVVSGAGARRFCRNQVRSLSQNGDAWGYRMGRRLLTPDKGDPRALGRVCSLRREGLSVTIYDTGEREIGQRVCSSLAVDGWEVRGIS
jgi:Protein kinase domain